MHLRIVLSYLPPLQPRPDHEGIHGPLDVLLLTLLLLNLAVHGANGPHATDTHGHRTHGEVTHGGAAEAGAVAHGPSGTGEENILLDRLWCLLNLDLNLIEKFFWRIKSNY